MLFFPLIVYVSQPAGKMCEYNHKTQRQIELFIKGLYMPTHAVELHFPLLYSAVDN